VSRIIRTLRETFDYIVIDMAPAFDEQVLTALDETDEVVLVTTLDVPTLKNVKVAVETFDALHIARDNRHLVLNRADDEVGINADKVEGILGMNVDAQISSSLEIAAATNAGSPVIVSDPEHQLSSSIRQLATRLAGEMVGTLGSTPETSNLQSEAEAKSRRSRRRK
jgi:pilus assembly protein CpaE